MGDGNDFLAVIQKGGTNLDESELKALIAEDARRAFLRRSPWVGMAVVHKLTTEFLGRFALLREANNVRLHVYVWSDQINSETLFREIVLCALAVTQRFTRGSKDQNLSFLVCLGHYAPERYMKMRVLTAILGAGEDN
jgi:hypothetical protein